METSFKFESFYRGNNEADELEIEIEIRGSEDEGGFVDSIRVFHGEAEIQLETLPKDEQAKIENQAQEIADENSNENWNDQQQSKADAWLDAYKHGDFE